MILKFLSRYTYKYPTNLVYMLQASEYYLLDFFDWYRRVKNFSALQKTGKLKVTAKSLVLLAIAWLEVFIILGACVYIYYLASNNFKYFSFVLFFLIPYILPFGLALPLLLLKLFVQKPLEIYAGLRVKKALQTHPAIKIGIAGSYGKTTMREILKSILGAGKKVSAPGSSINTFWGIYTFVKNLKGDEEILIFELGEYYPGDVKKLCNIINPDYGFVTGINEAHLKRFKTIDRTVATVFEITDCLGDKPVYINEENQLAKENARGNYKLYSSKGVGERKVEKASATLNGTSFDLVDGKNHLVVSTKLLGLHQIGPIAAGIDLARDLGLSEGEILEGLAKVTPFVRRLENKGEVAGVVTLDDSYNGNPDGVRAVISFLSTIKNKRRFYVTSGLVEIGDKTAEIHREIGKELAKAGIENVLLIKTSATPYIEEGLRESDYKGEIYNFECKDKAYDAIPQMTVKGDLVLLQTVWPDQYL